MTLLKYHDNTTSRSKKIQFFTPLVDKLDLENLTFISYFRICDWPTAMIILKTYLFNLKALKSNWNISNEEFFFWVDLSLASIWVSPPPFRVVDPVSRIAPVITISSVVAIAFPVLVAIIRSPAIPATILTLKNFQIHTTSKDMTTLTMI